MDKNNLFQEMYCGTSMAIASIEALNKTEIGGSIKEEINNQKTKYEELRCEISKKAQQLNIEITPASKVDKAMLWTSVFFNTVADHSDSKIAELMINGTNMGINNMIKVLNQMLNDSDATYGNRLLKMYEVNIDELKKYL